MDAHGHGCAWGVMVLGFGVLGSWFVASSEACYTTGLWDMSLSDHSMHVQMPVNSVVHVLPRCLWAPQRCDYPFKPIQILAARRQIFDRMVDLGGCEYALMCVIARQGLSV